MSRRQAAAYFEEGPSSAVRFARRYEDEGTVAVKPRSPQKRRLELTAKISLDDLWKAAGTVCDLFEPNECLNFFTVDG